ncbi:hypothetical protein D3C75_625660 [compost metagenome]
MTNRPHAFAGRAVYLIKLDSSSATISALKVNITLSQTLFLYNRCQSRKGTHTTIVAEARYSNRYRFAYPVFPLWRERLA